MATKSRTARSVPLGRGARRTRRGPGVAAGGGGGAAQECRVHFLAADTIILHLRARRQPTASPLPSKRRWRPCTRRTPPAAPPRVCPPRRLAGAAGRPCVTG